MQFRSSFKTVKFLFAWYFDGTSGCDTVKRTKLTEILDSFLREDKICIIRILLINTTLDINSSSKTSNFFDTRWWSKWMHLQHIPWKSSTDSLRQSQKQPCDCEHSYAVSVSVEDQYASMLKTQIWSTTLQRRRKDSSN